MMQVLDRIFGEHDDGLLSDDFTHRAAKFYDDPESRWEPVVTPHKTFYVLRHDPHRLQTIDRLVFLQRECTKLYTRLVMDPRNRASKSKELKRLKACLAPNDAICRIVQKPFGGYDVRAYAHDAWVFIELPTFDSIESESTEERKRNALLRIVVHELAHVAGYWEHDDKHEKCIAWLSKYIGQ